MRFAATKSMAVALGLILAMLTGCVNLGPGTTDRTRLYVLAPMQEDMAQALGSLPPVDALGVGPLAFPEYLNRPQIVTRIGESEIRTAIFNHWAEPLNRNFQRVLAENLSLLLGTNAVYTHPWRSTLKPLHRIEMVVTRFDAEPQGDAVLAVRWEVLNDRGETLIPKRNGVFRKAVTQEDVAGVVAAMSAVLADFSREAAAEIASRQ